METTVAKTNGVGTALDKNNGMRTKMDIIQLDYESRGLDICQFCGLKYNVGERIPRILVHCGHTLCTYCISELHH